MLPASGISGYNLQELIHQGTNTVIYRAISTAEKQSVILKVLNTDCPTIEQSASLKHEYQITKHIDSEYVIKVSRLEIHHFCLVLVLEDIGGISLKSWIEHLKNQPKLAEGATDNPVASATNYQLSLTNFFNIAVSLAKALVFLHQNQIIHKDIKPDNIIINPQTKQVKLADFSIASRLRKEQTDLKNPDRLEGTLAYMSPEQTGRMNRSIDYRSDFYSLGVTFYELLTGQLPFTSSDPLEMVHCHIAKQPAPLQQLNPQIPIVLTQIVAKLMAKNAELRYQTATGLLADLERCQNQIKNSGTISNFIPGQLDALSQLSIPQKLYGRETQIAQLLEVFDRVCKGSGEIVLVSGYSGIGKSALVHEIVRDITRQHGYFISGKFDQFKRNVPYACFAQAMGNFVQQILMESPTQLAAWRQTLLDALQKNARIAIDVIPELQLILGEQPPVPELGAIESQNRFNRVMKKFVQAIATAEHPLVIFLDDCQWMDAGTVNLYQNNCTEENPYFLLILAYRNSEVSPTHPFMLANEAMRATGIAIANIRLEPLAIYDVNRLVSDSLNCSPRKVASLAQLLLEKTHGNPFFLKQLLRSLSQENFLIFNIELAEWEWDTQEIKQQNISENVVDLMVHKIQYLSEKSQTVLQLAACINNEFNLDILSVVSEQSLTQTAQYLWEALEVGLILPVDGAYLVPQVFEQQELEKLGKRVCQVRYQFLHDRVQQAAYVMIPDSQKQSVHWKLGRLLLEGSNEAQRQEQIFDIVNHLNFARELIANSEELYELAQLNLQAGKTAKAASAFEDALTFFQAGCDCLPVSSWQDNYTLSFALNLELGEAEYLNGKNDAALAIFDWIWPQTQTLLEQCAIAELKITCLRMKNDLSAAYQLGIETLNSLGVEIEPYPDDEFLARELAETKRTIGRSIDILADLPELTDPLQLAAHRILKELFPIAYFTSPNAQYLCAMKFVQTSILYGNSPFSAFGYTLYAFTLVNKYREIKAGCAAGELSLNLYEGCDNKELGTCIFHMWGALTLHYMKYIDECKPFMLKAFNSGLETGAYQWSGYASINYLWVCFFGNESLAKATEIADQFMPAISKVDRNMLAYHLLTKNAIAQLTSSPETNLEPETFIDEHQLLEFAKSSADLTTAFVIYLYKLTQANWFGDVDRALEYALFGAEFLKGGAGHFVNPVFRFHHAIALAAACTNANDTESKLYRKQLNISLENFRDLAEHCPANYLHKYSLIQAEIAKLSGDSHTAAQHYDWAIASALKNGFIQNAALANELAARFYLAQNRANLAKIYLNDARFCYIEWGATAKVHQLEQSHPDWFNKISDERITINTTASTATDANIFDLKTVIKASQAISSEIVLEKLLKKLLHIILENAGAQTGCILLEQSGYLFVEVSDSDPQDYAIFEELHPVKNNCQVPLSIVNYVARTQEPLLLNDASQETLYQFDTYIQHQQPKSVLCAPIVYQGKSIGIVYLENNLVAGAFTPEGLTLLEMLTAQAAIAIANARSYASEQDKSRQLAESLENLQQSQAEIAQKEEEYRSIFESVADGLTLVDLETAKMVAVNPVACEMYGYSVEEFLKLNPVELLHPKYLHLFEEFMGTVSSRQEFYCESVMLRKDGTQFDIEVKAKFFEYRGKPHALSIGRDISQRKAAEQALQKSEAQLREKAENLEAILIELQQTQAQLVQTEKISQLGQLVAGVAHEVNNPIGFISGNLHHVQEYIGDLINLVNLYQKKFPEPGAEIEQEIESIDLQYLLADLPKTTASMKMGIDRIRDIMQSLRNYSRSDSQEKRAVDIHEGLETTLMILSHRLKAKHNRPAIKIIKHYGELPKLECHPGQINQVFMNLIANAIDAVEESNAGKTYAEIEQNPNIIMISTLGVGQQEREIIDTIVIQIADNGMGMSESVSKKIFAPFFTTKVEGKGTGLGLSICHQIVTERHGGTLECLSSLGGGTEFVISLPISGSH
ncbi:MAG: AAA family ATPase [Microcoleus sp. PH2017_10_PVI_O_A]|uniref:AAA family ATPase n=1 Tax=unclassified Microcoleus TaxID=2642155 RepID=UPI001D3C7C70|nr:MULTISPECIES: AAA family ATPase [unclassified Microcoleus]TAE79090.1 MAG: PAS domain S-box protein [Oscillatoriales cyanobacterium]MCC3408386.1 AAA family ATPase [Microcoleus sp. PH2017_10_PVI_O_A]MCC3462446.1 AAA family ATPase [Microcoleus sp. PH2017_11_PCY_U_A]MCC3480915.1 AAA family ATPase [Microcoleus sp. PH2017_12_PCY_D_A]MCC3562027.1 AAA family ATPase [Microcoleus sp. PH2017_27_LUM_O_A]